MPDPFAERLAALADEGSDIDNSGLLDRWSAKVAAFLSAAAGPGGAGEFLKLRHPDPWELHALRIGHLLGLVARLEAMTAGAQKRPVGRSTSTAPTTSGPAPGSKKVFVVHGHDEAAKESTARFLERLGLEPIVLHEQPNASRAVIDKFEVCAGDVAFAVVLLTPDDLGKAVGAPDPPKPRARQNVLLELGYFIGRLGRSRVCALHKGEIDLPSDFVGVLFIPLDPCGGWKTKLVQELREADLSVDLNALPGA